MKEEAGKVEKIRRFLCVGSRLRQLFNSTGGSGRFLGDDFKELK